MTFASPFPDVEIPDVGVHESLFGDLSESDADGVALVDAKTGAETSYRDLAIRVDAFAGALADRGIGVGDVVGLLSPNSSAFAVAFHGILRAGATATTINALFTAKDIAKQLTDAHAKMLITVEPLRAQAIEGAAHCGLSPAEVVILDGPGEAVDGHPDLDDLLASGADAPHVTFDPATHLAVLPYSSGTTGNPKGVMLTHRNLVANVAQIRPIQGVREHDTILAVLPFFHIYGMTVLLNAALHARAKLVIMPAFDLAEFLGNIARYKCTIAFIAPPVAVALAKHPMIDEHDLSSLQTIMSGAAPLDDELGHTVAHRTRLPGGAGLRHERTQSGQPLRSVRRRCIADRRGRATQLGRLDRAERRQQDHRPRDGCRDRCAVGGSQRARRAVVQGPQRDGGLPGQRRGDHGNH